LAIQNISGFYRESLSYQHIYIDSRYPIWRFNNETSKISNPERAESRFDQFIDVSLSGLNGILWFSLLHRASPCAFGVAPSELYMIKGIE